MVIIGQTATRAAPRARHRAPSISRQDGDRLGPLAPSLDEFRPASVKTNKTNNFDNKGNNKTHKQRIDKQHFFNNSSGRPRFATWTLSTGPWRRWPNRIFTRRLRANCHQLYELGDANSNWRRWSARLCCARGRFCPTKTDANLGAPRLESGLLGSSLVGRLPSWYRSLGPEGNLSREKSRLCISLGADALLPEKCPIADDPASGGTQGRADRAVSPCRRGVMPCLSRIWEKCLTMA